MLCNCLKREENQTMTEERSDRNYFWRGLLIGGFFGALAGILLAPKSGKELRSELKEKGGAAFEEAKQIYSDSTVKAKAILDEAKHRVEDLKREADRQFKEAQVRVKKILAEGEEETEEMDKSVKDA